MYALSLFSASLRLMRTFAEVFHAFSFLCRALMELSFSRFVICFRHSLIAALFCEFSILDDDWLGLSELFEALEGLVKIL